MARIKFGYKYKNREGSHLEGALYASSKEEVYSELKKQGIKPISVCRVPGFWNWAFSIWNQWRITILVVIPVVATVGVAIGCAMSLFVNTDEVDHVHPIDRCQIYGDPAIIADGNANDWSIAFERVSERYLARFAQPGREVVAMKITDALVKDLETAIGEKVDYEESDGDEIRKVKCIVEQMKEEVREYLKDGGSARSYLRRLVARQTQEIEFYRTSLDVVAREKKRLSPNDFAVFLDRRNEELRARGIRTIPASE